MFLQKGWRRATTASVLMCLVVVPHLQTAFAQSELAPPHTNEKLHQFYSQRANYNRVYDNVMRWFGTTTNACVAFASTALRMIGVNVPQGGIYEGEHVSLVTRPFSHYLQNELGWTKFTDPNQIKPGDLVFTVDDPDWPTYPAHVFVFHAWTQRDENEWDALAIDNQGYLIERNLIGSGRRNKSPMAYVLRAPK